MITKTFQNISMRLAVLLWFGLLAGSAFSTEVVTGSPGWLSVSPEFPQENRPIQAVIVSDESFCLVTGVNPQGDRFDVRLINGDIVLDLVGQFGICPPLLAFPNEFPLPNLDVGQYRLVVNRVGLTTLFPASELDREFLGEMTFGVSPGPMAVPVNHPLTLALLLLGMLVTASWFLRRSQQTAGRCR